MLFPVVGQLVAREEERLRLLEENRTLLADLEGSLKLREETVAERTRELRDRIEELQGESHSKTEFLSLISHKMRTPLTAIIGFAEIIANHIKESDQDHDQMVQSILRSALELGNFLNDAIEFLQRSSGNVSLTRAEFDLIPHLQRVIRERSRLHASRKVRVVFRGLNTFKMVGDARSIASAIDRVLDNAFRFSNPGDPLEVSLHEEAPSRGGGGPLMVLKVRDHGIGLHRHQVEKLFKPLEIYSSSPDRTLGHGLGLAIAQEVIRSHGGRILAESEGPNKGCLVTIELPMGVAGARRGDRIPLGDLQAKG
jgi:signal transduction histidine kinase